MKPLKTINVGPLKIDVLHALGTLLVALYVIDQTLVKDPVTAAALHAPASLLGAAGVAIIYVAHSILGISLPGDSAADKTPPPPPTLPVLAIAGLLSLGGTSCTPGAKSAIDAAINFSIEGCKEITGFVPPTTAPGAVVGLICQVIDVVGPPVEVVVDSNIWNAMKLDYQKTHDGKLPAGMSAPR